MRTPNPPRSNRQNHATFISPPAKRRLFVETDLLFFPTQYLTETFGLVVVEVMAFAKMPPWRRKILAYAPHDLFCFYVMGRVRRGGFIIEWYIGDHHPRHVHVFDTKGRFIGRLCVEDLQSLEGWVPNRDLLKIIENLKKEGKL